MFQVEQIYIYKNGVAYFKGKAKENILKVAVSDMDTVLKTMITNKDTVLSYPIIKDLRREKIWIDEENPVISTLQSLIGTTIGISYMDKMSNKLVEKKGMIMGLQEKTTFVGNPKVYIQTRISTHLTMQLDNKTKSVETFDLEDIKGFNFSNLINTSIANFLSSKQKSNKNSLVEIKIKRRKDDESKDVSFAKKIPDWKTVYALDIVKNELSLYAIFTNDTNNDWENITIHLLSEYPHTEHAELYKKYYHLRRKSTEIRRRRRNRRKSKGLRKMRLEEDEESLAESFTEDEEVEEEELHHDIEVDHGNLDDKYDSFKNYEIKNIYIPSNFANKVPIQTAKVITNRFLIFKTHGRENIHKGTAKMAVAVTSEENFSMKGVVNVMIDGNSVGESVFPSIPKDQEVQISYAKDVQCMLNKSSYDTVLDLDGIGLFNRVLTLVFHKHEKYLYEVKYGREINKEKPMELHLHDVFNGTPTLDMGDFLVKISQKSAKEYMLRIQLAPENKFAISTLEIIKKTFVLGKDDHGLFKIYFKERKQMRNYSMLMKLHNQWSEYDKMRKMKSNMEKSGKVDMEEYEKLKQKIMEFGKRIMSLTEEYMKMLNASIKSKK